MPKFLTLSSQCWGQPAIQQFYALCGFPCGKKEEKLVHINQDISGEKAGKLKSEKQKQIQAVTLRWELHYYFQ